MPHLYVPDFEHCLAFLMKNCNEIMMTVTIIIQASITTGLPIHKTEIVLTNIYTYYHYIIREGNVTAKHTHIITNEDLCNRVHPASPLFIEILFLFMWPLPSKHHYTHSSPTIPTERDTMPWIVPTGHYLTPYP
jgi:hypothetical protein